MNRTVTKHQGERGVTRYGRHAGRDAAAIRAGLGRRDIAANHLAPRTVPHVLTVAFRSPGEVA